MLVVGFGTIVRLNLKLMLWFCRLYTLYFMYYTSNSRKSMCAFFHIQHSLSVNMIEISTRKYYGCHVD